MERGHVFGKFVVEDFVRGSDGRRRVRCRCECGIECTKYPSDLTAGRVKSCGCGVHSGLAKGRQPRHGHTSGGKLSPTYYSWRAMITRCTNPSNKDWDNYGGRGIKVCTERVNSFDQSLADMGQRPISIQLDRKDVDSDYTLLNCRWATPRQNANNRRTNVKIRVGEDEHTLSEWCDIGGISIQALRRRIRLGWSFERAVTTPIIRKV